MNQSFPVPPVFLFPGHGTKGSCTGDASQWHELSVFPQKITAVKPKEQKKKTEPQLSDLQRLIDLQSPNQVFPRTTLKFRCEIQITSFPSLLVCTQASQLYLQGLFWPYR